MGPSKTKVWNSPFSPQGSAAGGRSRKKESSSSRPAKLGSRILLSMQAAMARNCCSWKRRINSRVSRYQMGKRAVMPRRARFREKSGHADAGEVFLAVGAEVFEEDVAE